MSSKSIKNGLEVDKLPLELADLTNLENTLVAVDIPVMKIRKVQKSQLEKMDDRTFLVPVEPNDIENTIKSTLLPRSMEESAVVSIEFKRMKTMKNTHQLGGVRPVKLVKAIAFFKDMKNPHYEGVMIKCMFCGDTFEDGKTDFLDHVERCHLDLQSTMASETGVENPDESEEEDLEESLVLPTVKKYQAQDDHSCITTAHPEVNIVVNTSESPIAALVKDSVTGQYVILAPREGKIPTNIMRELNFDVKAFLILHPSGKFGVDYQRAVELSRQQYFRARIFHYIGIFANNNDYLFMSQQFIERAQLEAQIDISVQKGLMYDDVSGEKSMKLVDTFSVFKSISGTPKFWQQKRYNLLAMINVLGPFQWFFTFSCAELRWPQVISCILRKKGHIVEVLDPNAATANAGIKVDNQSLIKYLQQTGQTLRGIVQKETVLVTRIFDQRVKSFIKNMLMDQGQNGMKLKNYLY